MLACGPCCSTQKYTISGPANCLQKWNDQLCYWSTLYNIFSEGRYLGCLNLSFYSILRWILHHRPAVSGSTCKSWQLSITEIHPVVWNVFILVDTFNYCDMTTLSYLDSDYPVSTLKNLIKVFLVNPGVTACFRGWAVEVVKWLICSKFLITHRRVNWSPLSGYGTLKFKPERK